jgi:D-alanyl-lipoteichoic acid acyltransferase DltB (MBOAT superfamily)
VLFNSYVFLFAFLPVTLAVCYGLARFAGAGAAQLWLIAASFYFYASWNLRYLPLLACSILFNYGMAWAMLHVREDRRRWLLTAAVVVDLGLLGYYKYTNFFVDTVNSLSGSRFLVAEILLPLGISFYTFQQITLLVDISGGASEKFRLRDFALFVIFFPHLIAGPIVHHREMMPQFLRASYRFDWQNMGVGATLFAVGLFKKAVLADGIANSVLPLYVDAGLGHPQTLIYAWAAAIGFALQMYFDFSGYSEMALGLARMLGIKLPMNFNSPLKSSSIIEYWACWHMTLTRFLTGYVYNPIAMSIARWRRARGWKQFPGPRGTLGAGITMIAAPTMATMFLSGLWHGAGNQYLVFGLLHGCYLTINHFWRLYRPLFWPDSASYDRVMKPVGLVLTFTAAAVALAYFHADSVRSGNNIVAGMAGLHGLAVPDVIASRLHGIGSLLAHLGVAFTPAPLPVLLTLAEWIVLLLAIALIPPNILQMMYVYEPAITMPLPFAQDRRIAPFRGLWQRVTWRPSTAWALAAAGLSACGILALNQVTAFLYWQF